MRKHICSVLKKESGLTLLEIMLSLALLAIILVSFLGLFSTGIATIIMMGDLSRASAVGQEIMDRVYAEADFATAEALRTAVADILLDMGGMTYAGYVNDLTAFSSNTTNHDVRYHITSQSTVIPGNTAYSITLRVFYRNYNRFAEITSPIVR